MFSKEFTTTLRKGVPLLVPAPTPHHWVVAESFVGILDSAHSVHRPQTRYECSGPALPLSVFSLNRITKTEQVIMVFRKPLLNNVRCPWEGLCGNTTAQCRDFYGQASSFLLNSFSAPPSTHTCPQSAFCVGHPLTVPNNCPPYSSL